VLGAAVGGGAAGCAAAPGTAPAPVEPGWPGALSDSAETPRPSSGEGADWACVPALAGPVGRGSLGGLAAPCAACAVTGSCGWSTG